MKNWWHTSLDSGMFQQYKTSVGKHWNFCPWCQWTRKPHSPWNIRRCNFSRSALCKIYMRESLPSDAVVDDRSWLRGIKSVLPQSFCVLLCNGLVVSSRLSVGTSSPSVFQTGRNLINVSPSFISLLWQTGVRSNSTTSIRYAIIPEAVRVVLVLSM